MVNATLGGQELQDKIFAGLEIYKGKSFIEQFGLFMGKAQLLEFGLKNPSFSSGL
ncbi:hypothetical protein [Yersinia intermedia]|uniref:hypothetical protein n=1 Tax=Yersinia intermedia TaxID=631 RepID=UPI0005E85429|nr:hypothetical protein [Yersinia intermedia]CNH94727.1 Uncharacterised protein [Yersinia intermedia]